MSGDQPDDAETQRAILPALIKKRSGTRNSDGSVSIRRWDAPEVVLYGPYWKLAAGTHRLEICCRSIRVRKDSAVFLTVEVLVQNRILVAIADYCLRDMLDGNATLDFCVPEEFAADSGNDAKFEFRVLHFGVARFDITAMTITRLSVSPVGASGELTWRLSSRLRRRWLLRWPKVEDFSTPSFRRGTFSGDPPLSLPRGAYALSFRASRPLGWGGAAQQIYVSVRVGRHLRGSRGYAIARGGNELHTLEFEVPADIALDHGANDRVTLEFGGRGSGSIHVTDVRLTQLRSALDAAGTSDSLTGTLASEHHVRTAVGPGRFHVKIVGRLCEDGTPSDFPIATIAIAVRPRFPAGTARAVWDVMRRPSSYIDTWTVRAEDFVNGVAVHGLVAPPTAALGSTERFVITARVERCSAALAIDSLSVLEEQAPEGSQEAPGAPALVGSAPIRIVIIGNCQAEVLTHGFSQFASPRPIIRYHFVDLQRNLVDRARADLKASDVVLIQDITDFETYPLRSEIPRDVLTCHFPMLRFSTPWPFDAHNGLPDPQAAARDAEEPYFPNLDGALARLRREIPDPEARWQAYRRLDFDWGPDIVRLSRFEERRLVAMDRRYDFALGAYILENFRKRPVFHSVGHPNGQLLSRLLQDISRRIGLKSRQNDADAVDHLRNIQVPIHPVVAQRLGIVWANERTRYQFRGAPVTWEEYIRRYIKHFG